MNMNATAADESKDAFIRPRHGADKTTAAPI